MRVAFVASSAPARTAIGNLVADKAAFFVDRGAEVRVFLESTAGLHPLLSSVAEACPHLPRTGATWGFLVQCDIVFFEFSQGCELFGLLPLLVDEKPRLIATYYGISPAADWPGPQRHLLELGLRQRGLLWCADAVVVFSGVLREELVAATGLPRSRVHSLPVAVDVERWGAKACGSGDGRDTRDGAKPRPTERLLFVGRLAPNKRLPLLVEALAHLPNAEAWIVGDDSDVYADQAGATRALAQRLGVHDRLRWLGDVPENELPALYRQADVLVQPSIHEGLGIPVLEAQAAGLPVVAARATALPETIADAGLTFRPDDVVDLVRQLRRVLGAAEPVTPPKKRIALVAFRFGSQFVGGAETSLRNIGQALRSHGYEVEVFTTCTIREHAWQNDLPAGDTVEDGMRVHRFLIDPHDRRRHDEAFRAILAANGDVGAEIEAEYLDHSIQSSALLAALAARVADFDALIVTPYLHGLTCRVADRFPKKTLLLGCFHDEPLGRLKIWPDVYGSVAGVLFHTPEEQQFAQATLGINNPGAVLIGTWLPNVGRVFDPFPPASDSSLAADDSGRIKDPSHTTTHPKTLVYCGRYSAQKNVPLLLDWVSRYQAQHPDRFRWQFVGEGGVPLPAEPWLRNYGRVADKDKHRILASADALVQLSTCESLSLVVLEAWQHAVPVVVHQDAGVLAGQLARSDGGAAVGDFAAFAQTLDDLWRNPADWRQRGENGRRYVEATYLDREAFASRLIDAIERVPLPLAERMRRAGLARVQSWSRDAWRERFSDFIDRVLDAPPRTTNRDLAIEPLSSTISASPRQLALLVPLRLHNRGDIPIEPLTTHITATLDDTTQTLPLTDLILPGRSATLLAPVELPGRAGRWTLQIAGGRTLVELPLEIGEGGGGNPIRGGVAPLLEAAEQALVQAHRQQKLPRDYVDVCEGRLARWKRLIKQKLLNNFKRAYVDVLSTQQSEVNRQLVESVQQLTECCRALDQTVRTLQQRVAELSRPCEGEEETEPCDASSRID